MNRLRSVRNGSFRTKFLNQNFLLKSENDKILKLRTESLNGLNWISIQTKSSEKIAKSKLVKNRPDDLVS